jgi:lysyl-tRNA synthetase class 2
MSEAVAASPWWDRERHRDRRGFLAARTAITRGLRHWFDAQGFIEVETGVLQVSPGNETHLHAPRTELRDAAGASRTRYLRTSPEFSCKKLLAAGETKIVEFARVFRDREAGPLHLPEFTMLELYRASSPVSEIMGDCVAVIASAAEATQTRRFSFRGRQADPSATPECLTVQEAFARHADIDLLATVVGQVGDREALARAASGKITIAEDDDWSDIFSKLLVALIEPQLGNGRLTLLTDYPAPEAALAQLSARDPRVAERFELYACGIELANGFGELTDAAMQRMRFEAAMDEKHRRYGERYPLDAEFLAALDVMPEASGVALGFDRLVMLAAGATRIDQVVWTPAP